MRKLFISYIYKLILVLGVIIILLYSNFEKFIKVNKDHSEKYAMELNKKQNVIKSEELAMKYILQWTSANNVPFVYMGRGQKGFIDRKCPHTNCYVTGNRSYFKDITKFDVIAFSGPEVIHYFPDRLPKVRKPHQKYVFASIESSHYYPVCSNRFDNFFNWTWTYRLDSEVRWGYMVIRDEHKNVVGPNKNMYWMNYKDMAPVSDKLKTLLKSKTKAAAWFVSNCYSKSGREDFVKKLQAELVKYDLGVDIFGGCGSLKCSRDNETKCFDLIKENYYFYLSFENSYSEDYVTEKLLNAVQNNAVPVVYGAANYSRFLPEGAYLNAKDLGVRALASKMYQLIKSPKEYADYFRWKNHYSYHRKMESVYTDEYCQFCSILNDKQKAKEVSVYKNFRKWWDVPNLC